MLPSETSTTAMHVISRLVSPQFLLAKYSQVYRALGVLFFQCMLHWRYALNGNATVKGTGTWQPVEDERMLSLVQVSHGCCLFV